MTYFKQVVAALALCALTFSASATPADPKNGVEYLTLATPQPTSSGKKIEVTEFFAYYCPHCSAFEPALAAWVKKQGAAIVFKRVHVQNGDSVLPQQRLFFTLEAIGLLEQYHNKIFNAMHVEHKRLGSDQAVFDFITQQGIDSKKFIDTYQSFGVAARVRRANAMMQAYQIDSWPTIAIDGRYLTSPAQANEGSKSARDESMLDNQVLSVMDHLVAQAKAAQK